MRDDEARFARILPIVGDALADKRIGIIGRRGSARLIEYLACCGVGWFDLMATTFDETAGSDDETCAFHMLEHLRTRLQLDIMYTSADLESCHEMLRNREIDLFIGTGGWAEYELARGAVAQSARAGIFYFITANGCGLIALLRPEDVMSTSMDLPAEIFARDFVGNEELFFRRLHLESAAANYAKGLLLAGSAYARRDIDSLPANGVRFLLAGHPSWPWTLTPMTASSLISLHEQVNYNIDQKATKIDDARATYLIIGLGSLGSVAAQTLNGLAANLVLIDGEQVDEANPIRQIYHCDQIGTAKAQACAISLVGDEKGNWQCGAQQWQWQCGARTIDAYQFAIGDDEASQEKFAEIIKTHRPTAAIVATGTSLDRVISQKLRNAEVPHVVVSCYARARYFEAIIVDHESPCFGCVRGHLYLGTPPELTREERARYISNAQDLAAEPATRVETGRAADLAAHIAYELARPTRAHWLARAQAEARTFFLGGNCAQQSADGDWVYGIEWPGEVRLFGLPDIIGRSDYLTCWDCGKQLPVAVRYQEQQAQQFMEMVE